MPPVSYWAQQAWAKVFGLSELAMRSFSLVCVAASILVVHSAARRARSEGSPDSRRGFFLRSRRTW